MSNARKIQFCKQLFEIIQGQIVLKNTVQCVNKQTVVLLLHPRTEYKKIGPFLERGINFRRNFFRTGSQFGVPGDTYPPEKYRSAPPPPGACSSPRVASLRGLKVLSLHDSRSTTSVNPKKAGMASGNILIKNSTRCYYQVCGALQ